MHPALRDIAPNLAGAVIALDFDGTLAPIVSNPRDSRPEPGAVAALTQLALAGARIAIVTGRDARTVLALGDLEVIPEIMISGLHGAETWRDGELTTRDEPAGISQLRELLPSVLKAEHPDIWLEDKRLSLVVHTRQAPEPDAALTALEPAVTRLARAHGLDVHPGKLVLEIRIPDLSKGDAVDALLTDTTSAVVFAGDDLGDLPAFAAVHRWRERTGHPAVTLAIGEVSEVRSAADYALDRPRELTALLTELAAAAT